MNAQEQENNSDSSKIVNVKPIENSPFNIVTLVDGRTFLSMGMERLSEPVPEEDTQKLLDMVNAATIPWTLIMNLFIIMTKYQIQIKENTKLPEDE